MREFTHNEVLTAAAKVRQKMHSKGGEMMKSELTMSFSGRMSASLIRKGVLHLEYKGLLVQSEYIPDGGGRKGTIYTLVRRRIS